MHVHHTHFRPFDILIADFLSQRSLLLDLWHTSLILSPVLMHDLIMQLLLHLTQNCVYYYSHCCMHITLVQILYLGCLISTPNITGKVICNRWTKSNFSSKTVRECLRWGKNWRKQSLISVWGDVDFNRHFNNLIQQNLIGPARELSYV